LFPNFDLEHHSGHINDYETNLIMDMAPHLKIIQDLMWDVNDKEIQKTNVGGATDLKIILKCELSNYQDVKKGQ
jgi:hypothetical protein